MLYIISQTGKTHIAPLLVVLVAAVVDAVTLQSTGDTSSVITIVLVIMAYLKLFRS